MVEERWEYHTDCNEINVRIAEMLIQQSIVIKAHKEALVKLRSIFRDEIYYRLCQRDPTASSLRYNTYRTVDNEDLSYKVNKTESAEPATIHYKGTE